MDDAGSLELTLYPLTPDAPQVIPAPRSRKWIQTNANPDRCLPFSIASQAGWWVLNPAPFTAFCRKDGQVEVEYESGWKIPSYPGKSHFGGGILTLDIPYIFRTNKSWDLLIRGAANLPLAGAYCFDGIIESSWSTIPIPSNWQLEVDREVKFAQGFPIAQIVPIQTRRLMEFETTIEYSRDMLTTADEYYQSRKHDYTLSTEKNPPRKLTGYFKGERPDGQKFDNLQRLDLKEFVVRG